MNTLNDIYDRALDFTEKHHFSDIIWIQQRLSLIKNFDDFFEEYCCVVIASGFKGLIASQLAHNIALAKGDYNKSFMIFKNQRKIKSICQVYSLLYKDYQTISETWETPQDLIKLPYIGEVTCFHLARNIGLQSTVKPDLHLKKLILQLFNKDDDRYVQKVISDLAAAHSKPQGEVDFVLWVYLSHNCGVVNSQCCDGKRHLR